MVWPEWLPTETSGAARAQERTPDSSAIADGRTQSLLAAAAYRHSRRVRLLKVVLLITAVTTAVLAAMNILKSANVEPTLPSMWASKVVANNLKMHNPHYQGFNSDGSRYWLKAETAQQDLKTLTVVHLDGITGELTDAKKQKTYLTATRSIFDNKSDILELFDSISVTGDDGLNAKLTRARIQTKEAIITSNQPSTVIMAAGQITSNQLTIRQKTKKYLFLEGVRTHMRPKDAPTASDKTAPNEFPFGKPGQPVDIAANRLDIDDIKKTAIYSGHVVATQDGATVTAKEMVVTYEGSVAPESKGGNQNKPVPTKACDIFCTRVKLIVAKESVVLKQPNGETATSKQATFNTISNTAVLEGDVVLSQGDDRHIAGDRLDYDQAAQAMILTGPVVVTHGADLLKGGRLVYNHATQKMQLSTPVDIMGSTSPGQITAHFIKPSSKILAIQSNDDNSEDSISLGATFKTDPNSPFDVISNKLDVDDNTKTAIFTDNVSAVLSAVTMRSQELTALYTGGSTGMDATGNDKASDAQASIAHLAARKNVVITVKDGQTATGDWAEVDVKKNLATMGGAVVLTQGKNVVHGTRLVINMNTGEATIKTEPMVMSSGAIVSSSGGGQIYKVERPNAVFYPNQFRKSKIQADGWRVRMSP